MKMKLNLFTIPMTVLLCQMTVANAEMTKKDHIQGEAYRETEEVKAKVTNINYETREVTILGPDGKFENFVAGDDVKNLNQIKKGDFIVAEYSEALVYEVNKGGSAVGATETIQAQTARPGDKPGASAERKVSSSVIITAIDKKEPSVTFKNAEGELSKYKVKHPEKLEGVKVGDKVDLTYTEALAIRVDKATTKQ